jgi:hypothetical protein
MLACLLTISGTGRAQFKFFSPLPEDTAGYPKLLSATGFYADIAAKRVTPEAVYYDLNAEHWADGASQFSWIVLAPGKTIPYNDTTDLFDYPDSTVFVKTFTRERVQGNPASHQYIETRFLVNREDSATGYDTWYGFSYRWRGDGREADLVSRNPGASYDTAYQYTTADGRLIYKKWSFPSQMQCLVCHRMVHAGSAPDVIHARGALSFFPAQLKRPADLRADGQPNTDPAYNQIHYLFDRGVFSGTRPTGMQLARRWLGIHEPLPPVSSPDERYHTLDYMARSYLASNCSGCHGVRGLATQAMGTTDKNWDFYRLKAEVEFSSQGSIFMGLNDTSWDTSALWEPTSGRQHFLLAVRSSGVAMTPGAIWDMALPPGDPASLVAPLAVYPGYPSLSKLLYRQWARNTHQEDSGRVFRDYLRRSRDEPPDTVAAGRLAWLFAHPWGSRAWLDALAAHGLTLDSVLAGQYIALSMSMPPLGPSLPDIAAMRVLGEWTKTYRPFCDTCPPSGIRFKQPFRPEVRARVFVRGQMLAVPSGWQGRAFLITLAGRAIELRPAGKDAFALPRRLTPGTYVVRIGGRTLKAAIF